MLPTKESLKELHSAPEPDSFETLEEYLEAKRLWKESNEEIYQQILSSPSSEDSADIEGEE